MSSSIPSPAPEAPKEPTLSLTKVVGTLKKAEHLLLNMHRLSVQSKNQPQKQRYTFKIDVPANEIDMPVKNIRELRVRLQKKSPGYKTLRQAIIQNKITGKEGALPVLSDLFRTGMASLEARTKDGKLICLLPPDLFEKAKKGEVTYIDRKTGQAVPIERLSKIEQKELDEVAEQIHKLEIEFLAENKPAEEAHAHEEETAATATEQKKSTKPHTPDTAEEPESAEPSAPEDAVAMEMGKKFVDTGSKLRKRKDIHEEKKAEETQLDIHLKEIKREEVKKQEKAKEITENVVSEEVEEVPEIQKENKKEAISEPAPSQKENEKITPPQPENTPPPEENQ